MVTYTCEFCRKDFKRKQSAKNHLENSHKKEILNLEIQQMKNSLECAYCGKSIESSIESHLPPHYKDNYNQVI
jgi:transcription elongation factor Elf1